MGGLPDPFGTAGLRSTVLASWAASPNRFREDANAEDLLAGGGYAGRALVELAANGVDAARAAGVRARLRMRLDDGELRVANTGAALTVEGVAALASLRASAKRDGADSVGFFGVGFTAVLGWTAAPRVVSTTGGIRFDASGTRAAIRELAVPGLDAELARRDGHVPVLRLPWPADPAEQPPAGYATEVRLPLAGPVRDQVAALLADPDTVEDLVWALPELTEIDLPDRVLRRHAGVDGSVTLDDGVRRARYRVVTHTGEVPAELLIDRPVEQRTRSRWRISWVLPLDPPPVDRMYTVGAPTPTDEPLTFPARLVGTLPVDDTRRRLQTGPLCDHLLDRAADAYLDLVLGAEPGDRWRLLPVSGFPAGPVDATLRADVVRRARGLALFPSATGDRVAGRDALIPPGVDGQGAALIGEAIPGLLAPLPPAAAPVLRALGATTVTWSQVSAALAGIDRPPAFWRRLYAAVATAEPRPQPEDLADIPVPLVGGRRTLGARGCLLTLDATASDADGPIDAALARRIGDVVPGLHVVHPDAAHPLLQRLGARAAVPAAVLADPALMERVERLRRDLEDTDVDSAEVVDVGGVLLDLLAADPAAVEAPGPDGAAIRRVLDDLVLTDDDGNPWPATELLMPDAPLRQVLADDVDRVAVGPRWLRDHGADLLVLAGVRDGFPVIVVDEGAADHDRLPDLDEWTDTVAPSGIGQFRAVADLDLVDEHRWAEALALIAGDRRARDCLAPLGGRSSYGAWWIARHAQVGGRPPGDWRLPAAADLAGLYDPLPIDLDVTIAGWIGVRTDLAAAASADAIGLMDRLADPDRTVPAARVPPLTSAVVDALDRVGAEPDLPTGVRTLSGAVVDARRAFVLDAPWWVQVQDPERMVPGGVDPAVVARVLDLRPVSEVLDIDSIHASGTADEAAGGRWARAAAAVGLDPATVPVTFAARVGVSVGGRGTVRVGWWCAEGRYYSDGSAASAGRIAAWAAGSWSRRHIAVAAAAQDAVGLAEAGVADAGT